MINKLLLVIGAGHRHIMSSEEYVGQCITIYAALILACCLAYACMSPANFIACRGAMSHTCCCGSVGSSAYTRECVRKA